VIHLSLAESKRDEDHPLNGDQWEKFIDEVGNLAAELGVEIAQVHLPYYTLSDPMYTDPAGRAHFDRAMFRSIHASSVLGVKWAIAHTNQEITEQMFAPQLKAANMAYNAQFVEAAKKAGVGICFENMMPNAKLGSYNRYPVTHWELIDFVDSWNDPAVGICWDFGHANACYPDQSIPLRAIGKRLKTVHIQDNYGESDMHYAPFQGTTDWERAIQGLVDIDYEGDLTLEAAPYRDDCPMAVQHIAAKFTFEIGCYLLDMYEAKLKQRG